MEVTTRSSTRKVVKYDGPEACWRGSGAPTGVTSHCTHVPNHTYLDMLNFIQYVMKCFMNILPLPSFS